MENQKYTTMLIMNSDDASDRDGFFILIYCSRWGEKSLSASLRGIASLSLSPVFPTLKSKGEELADFDSQ